MKIIKDNKISFIQLFILFFLIIGTRTIIESKFSIIGSMELHGAKYLLVDFLYFSLIGFVYLSIYYFLQSKQKETNRS